MDVIRTHLDGNADAVEFCPDYPFQHILAASTYTLHETPQPHRVGSISLFSVQDKMQLKLLQGIKTSGVFDIKWRPGTENKQPNLAQADSDGNVTIYCLQTLDKVTQADEDIEMKELFTQNISCSSMCLTLDWDKSNTSLSSRFSVGLAEGLVSVVSLREAQMQIEHIWQAHQFEVWAVAHDSNRADVLYSGADDCNFCGWDLRENSGQPIFRNTKSHQMGVCSIQKSPQSENSFITGSYDEHLRLWDLRLMERPVLQESVGLGGGVWKLKFHPNIGNMLLAACMHNGFAIVRLESDGMKVVEEYKGHESLAYGADWFKGDLNKIEGFQVCTSEVSCSRNRLYQEENPQLECGNESIARMNECISAENSFDNGPSGVLSTHQRALSSLVATCSFYDKALHIWKPKNLSLT